MLHAGSESWEVGDKSSGDGVLAPISHHADVSSSRIIIDIGSSKKGGVAAVRCWYSVLDCKNLCHVKVFPLLIQTSVVPMVNNFT